MSFFKKIGDSWNRYWWGKEHPHRDNVIEDVYLRLYTGTTIHNYADFKLPRSLGIIDNKSFNKGRPTMLYIHGYEETTENESIKVIFEAYLEAKPNTNLILVDWSNMAFGSYFLNAAPNIKLVAEGVANELRGLIKKGLNLDTLHLIGHSLGGQMVGFIGKELQKHHIKVKRITALDPAFPMFYPNIFDHISAEDGEFVDIIHTDAGGYGAPSSTGTIDWWPNGGAAKQPGCPKFAPVPLSNDSLCSHWRSWRFWAESIKNPTAFPGVSANSYKAFKQDNRGPNPNRPVIYLGDNTDRTATGNYYMITNCCTPFGKGLNGTYVIKE